MGVRLQEVKPDIRLLYDPSENDERVERERSGVEYRNEVRNGEVILEQYLMLGELFLDLLED